MKGFSKIINMGNKNNEFSNQYQKAAVDAAFVWDRVKNGISDPEPIILSANGEPIAHKNSIIIIQGKAGSHKSRLAAALTTLLISRSKNTEIIGMSRPKSDEFSILYVDTERNILSQLPSAMKQILRNSGHDDSKHYFDLTVLPLISVRRQHRYNVLRYFLEQMKLHTDRGGRHIVVVLDVITDCVSDFNQLSETYSLIDMMNETINKEDVTFICIIHENPYSEKARGHLGTELANKASTVFQISETADNDLFKIKVLKSRNTRKHDEIIVRYDPETSGLTLVNFTCGVSDRKGIDQDPLVQALGKLVVNTIERPDLFQKLKKQLGLSERSLQYKIDNIINNKVKIESVLGSGTLQKVKGRPVKYQLIYDEAGLNGL